MFTICNRLLRNLNADDVSQHFQDRTDKDCPLAHVNYHDRAASIAHTLAIMADPFAGRTLKRKNVKGLALAAPAPKVIAPSDKDNQIGGSGNNLMERSAQLEIGIEYKLDLKREDLEVLKELGYGNGGTVSKVKHIATGTVMARKVCFGAHRNMTDC